MQFGPTRSVKAMNQKESLKDFTMHPDQSDGTDVVYISRLVNVLGEEVDVREVLSPRSSPYTKTDVEQAAQNTREGRRKESLKNTHIDTIATTSTFSP